MQHVDATPEGTFARVRKFSLWLQRLASLGMVAFVAFAASVIVFPVWFDGMVATAYPDLTIAAGINAAKRTVLLMMLGLPLAVTLYGLWNVRLLFGAYARGEVFSTVPAAYIRNVGSAMLVNVVLSVLVHSIGSVVLTYQQSGG